MNRAFLAALGIVFAFSAHAEDLGGRVVATGKTEQYQFQIRHNPADPKKMEITLFAEKTEACTLPITDWKYRDPSGFRVQYAFWEAKIENCPKKTWSQWMDGQTVLSGYLRPRGQRAPGSITMSGPNTKTAHFPIQYGWLRSDEMGNAK